MIRLAAIPIPDPPPFAVDDLVRSGNLFGRITDQLGDRFRVRLELFGTLDLPAERLALVRSAMFFQPDPERHASCTCDEEEGDGRFFHRQCAWCDAQDDLAMGAYRRLPELDGPQ